MPYQSRYTLGEVWAEMTQSKMYQDYATKNPVESAAIADHVAKKLAEQADFIPIDLAKTHFGKALVYIMLTLPPT